ncbi:Peptidyl-prolyl isomerase cwc27 [Boothiomyces macroporosus]|uniref:Peptidyl-prolyl isomerase CWC27 n=1 Tax=Boothiomyces macroporosus TaxID=261099 RepID=A0AAD5Y8I6_9FUNG|nr:Peptidyl-prolyl isomerase cwc27 [Boothiomyces macroporosus]
MSSAYVSQPATKGKVIMKTSAGDLEIELWSKEAPKACRNFVQLCMEGYYDNTLFHRIVPGFIVQGGDPTGTGMGGESIYGHDFDDEYHSRLKFNMRGLLAMANTQRHANRSQFFFTLDAAPQLTGKNTIFGKVVGDTVFNLLKLGELETDKDERPVFEAKVITTEVLNNPFDDIIPRTTREEKLEIERKKEQLKKEMLEASKPKATKNFSLLSFGQEAESDEKAPKMKIKSSHDINDPNLSNEVADLPIQKKRKVEKTEEEDFDQKMKEKVVKKQIKEQSKISSSSNKLDQLQEQLRKLQGEIKGMDQPKKEVEKKVKRDKSSVARMREEYMNSGRAVQAIRKDIKGDVEQKLKGFEEMLKKNVKTSKPKETKPEPTGEVWECALHFIPNCSSCRDTFGQVQEEDDDDWMNASLKFEKEIGANVYEPKIDDYTIIDPRQAAKKADPFGRDIKAPGDIKGRKEIIWTEKSTRSVKPLVDQWAEQPDYYRG